MAAKPNFRSNAVSRVDLTSTLARGAVTRAPEPLTPEMRPSLVVNDPVAPPARRRIDSRRKKLAHLKTLLEYEEKKEIMTLLRDMGDAIGHNLQFSILSRGLLLAALAHKEERRRPTKPS